LLAQRLKPFGLFAVRGGFINHRFHRRLFTLKPFGLFAVRGSFINHRFHRRIFRLKPFGLFAVRGASSTTGFTGGYSR
jgi:hypothetical protein